MDNAEVIKNVSEVVALILFLYLTVKAIIYGFIEGMKIWREVSKERAAIDQKRNDLDLRQVEVNEKVSLIMEKVGKGLEHVGELKDTVITKHDEIVKKIEKMDQTEDTRFSELKTFHDEQYKSLWHRLDLVQEQLKQVTESTRNIPIISEKIETVSRVIEELKALLKKDGE